MESFFDTEIICSRQIKQNILKWMINNIVYQSLESALLRRHIDKFT